MAASKDNQGKSCSSYLVTLGLGDLQRKPQMRVVTSTTADQTSQSWSWCSLRGTVVLRYTKWGRHTPIKIPNWTTKATLRYINLSENTIPPLARVSVCYANCLFILRIKEYCTAMRM